jgi:chloramphenicol 3-O-phosphotransferase
VTRDSINISFLGEKRDVSAVRMSRNNLVVVTEELSGKCDVWINGVRIADELLHIRYTSSI